MDTSESIYEEDQDDVRTYEHPFTGQDGVLTYYHWGQRKVIRRRVIRLNRPDRIPTNGDDVSAIVSPIAKKRFDGRNGTPEWRAEMRQKIEDKVTEFLRNSATPRSTREIADEAGVVYQTMRRWLNQSPQFERVEGRYGHGGSYYWRITGDTASFHRKRPRQRTWRHGEIIGMVKKFVADNGPVTIQQIADGMGYTYSKVQKIVAVRFADEFNMVKIKVGPGRPLQHYTVKEDDDAEHQDPVD